MAAYLANVGVNAAHSARSPLRPDGGFTLLPIPEALPWRRPMRRLAEFPDLAALAPPAWSAKAVHLDPDFTVPVPTYGDNCRRAGRAYSLRRAVPGETIHFLARLHPLAGTPVFAIVANLIIDRVLADVTSDPGPGWWDANAHVRRARAHGGWDSFWVFGGAAGSGLLRRAVAFGRGQAEFVFGPGWEWRPGRTELQTIGSYTRAVRRLTGTAEERLRELAVG